MFQAWLTFAVFDNARRAHLGIGLDEYRARDRRDARADDRRSRPRTRTPGSRSRASADEIVDAARPTTAWSATRTRSTWSSVMDVDMAARARRRDATSAPTRSASPPTGASTSAAGATRRDPVLVAEHPDLCALAGDGGGERGGARGARASASTTSRTSTSTRASRARCTSRATRSGSRPTTRAALTRHRRPAVPRRPGERLPHALDRGDGRAAPRRSRRARAGQRRRHAHDQARLRRVLDDARRGRAARRDAVQAAVDARAAPTWSPSTTATRRSPRTRSCTAATASRSGRCSSATSPTARAPTRRFATPTLCARGRGGRARRHARCTLAPRDGRRARGRGNGSTSRPCVAARRLTRRDAHP